MVDNAFLTARLLLGLVFALSSLAKLREPTAFARGVARFGLLPSWSTRPAALILIAVEAAIAFSLLFGIEGRVGIIGAASLILFFTGLMGWNARRTEPLPCFCFGTGSSEVEPRKVLARLGLLLALVLVTLLRWVLRGSVLLARPPSLDAILFAVAALLLGSWLLQFPALRTMHRTPIPAFANPGGRLSLRGIPLPPLESHEDEVAQ